MKNQRSLLLFEQSVKSIATLVNYKDHLKRFLKFVKIQDCDSLIKMPKEQTQELVEDYVMYLKRTVNPNSVPIYMTGVKHFFIVNRIQLFWEIIQKLYPAQIKRAGYKPWITEQIRKMIEHNSKKRNKAIIHFLASTGSRIGVFNYDLSMKNLRDMGDGCKAVLIYAGEVDEYWSFLTPEASDSLNDYFEQRKDDGEKFYPDSPIFRTNYTLAIEKAKPVRRNAVISMIYRTINQSRIKRNRVHKHFDIQMDHGFRKRFNVIMKLDSEINSNIAEKIMGHSVTIPLDNSYLPIEPERLFEEFKKAIPELSISDEVRLRIENNIKEQKISEFEKKDKRIDELEKRFKNIQRLLERAGSKKS